MNIILLVVLGFTILFILQNIIENNLYSDDEPMLHQYVEE